MLKEEVFYQKKDMVDIKTQNRLYFKSTINKFDEYKVPKKAYNRNMNRIIKRYLKEKSSDFDAVNLNNEILQGMPVINGTRLPLTLILAYIRDEENFEEILEDFPYISKEQIADSLDYLINVIGDPYQDE